MIWLRENRSEIATDRLVANTGHFPILIPTGELKEHGDWQRVAQKASEREVGELGAIKLGWNFTGDLRVQN
jgi:hypothetical protein